MEDEESQVSRMAKQKAKNLGKKILIKLLPYIIGLLLVIVIASSVFSIFTSIMDKMVELAANVKTNVISFWKWVTDDYWIKLDKEIEFTVVDPETRTRNNKKGYFSR